MNTIGLIGGISPESTVIYYRLLSDAAKARLGASHSASFLLYTLDFGVMLEHYDNRDWDAYTAEVVKAAKHLVAGGAEALVICSNTSHVAAGAVMEATGLPLIHTMDALTEAMNKVGAQKPLLLGTPVVMSEGFYKTELAKRYAAEVTSPSRQDQEIVGRIILDELVSGTVLESSRVQLLELVSRYDCDGVILGCTELCMILSQDHFSLPVFDTTGLHAMAASAFSFGEI